MSEDCSRCKEWESKYCEAMEKYIAANHKVTKLRCALDSVSQDETLSEASYALCRKVLFETKP